MIEALLDWAAAHPVLEKVELGVFATNERARALYRRIGFVEEVPGANTQAPTLDEARNQPGRNRWTTSKAVIELI
jgi:hypothetical protein